MRTFTLVLALVTLFTLWIIFPALASSARSAPLAQSVPVDTTGIENLGKLADVLQTSLLVVVLLTIVILLWRAYQSKVDELAALQRKQIEWYQTLFLQRPASVHEPIVAIG
jgi:hypothetical protein